MACINGHSKSLTDSQVHGRRGKCIDWNEVGLDNREVMADEGNYICVFDGRVDEAEEMAFPWGQDHFRVLATCTTGIDVGAVEENVVTWWWSTAIKLGL